MSHLQLDSRLDQRILARTAMAMIIAVAVVITTVGGWALHPTTAAAQPTNDPTAEATGDLPKIIGVPGAKLAHPGVGQNGAQLTSVRDHVVAGDEPWATYYALFAASGAAAKDYVIANDADPGSSTLTPKYSYDNYNSGFFNNQMTADANAAYAQAVMFFLTGDVDYRSKAMRIVRLWSLFDPSKAKPVVDAHIQQGPPMYTMNAAVDLLRSTSSPDPNLAWSATDQDHYVTNFIEPPLRLYMHQNGYFFNQQQTAVMASMSSFVVMDDVAGYAEQVEWFTVNSTTPATNAYSNGSLSNALFDVDVDASGQRLQHQQVVVKEMMRDQPHASGNLQGITTIARMVEAQGTKVDPTKGTVSTAANAVGPWEFMSDRILKAANLWTRYNLGYLTPYNDGRNAPLSDYARGRAYIYPEIYFHYRYVDGYRDDDPDMVYVAKGFHNAQPVADISWLSIPDQAASMKPSTLQPEASGAGPFELERRYTALDNRTSLRTSKGTTFVSAASSPQGARFAVTNFFSWRAGSLALRIRTTAITTLELRRDAGTAPIRSITLPDTGGQWRYVTFSLADLPAAAFPTDFQIMFFSVVGQGSRVDLDHLLVSSPDVTPPTFADGRQTLAIAAWVGEQVSVSVAATDTDADDRVSYRLTGAPKGVTVAADGTLTWTPSAAGSSAFWVDATDETVITPLHVQTDVAPTYAEALDRISAGHDDGDLYTSTSFAAYTAALQKATSATGDDRQGALAALQAATDALKLLSPELPDGTLDYSTAVTTIPSRVSAANLVDGDPTSFTTDLWIADDKSMQFDFGTDFRVDATEFRVLPRAGFTARTAGTVVFGSDDQHTWTQLTDAAVDSAALQSLPVLDAQQGRKFRLLRFKDLDSGVSNRGQVVEDQPLSLSEVRIVGHRTEVVSALRSVTLSTTGGTPGRAATGDTVKLSFTATEDISDVAVTLLGAATPATAGPDHTWTAERTVTDDSPAGPARFLIDYRTADGTQASTALFTTDGGAVLVSPSADALDVTATAAVTVSSGSFDTGSAASLFDSRADTYTEFRNNGSGAGAWLTFDFGSKDAKTKAQLSAVEFLPRQGFSSRVAGTTVQGSNDLTTWSTLTSGAVDSSSWQRISVLDAQRSSAFRYIRVTNAGTWYGNLAELRLFGAHGDDLTDATAPTYTVSVGVDDSAGGTVALGAGDTADSGTTKLTGVATGALVTATAEPADGYVFDGWTQRKTVEGIEVDVNVSGWPTYNPGYFTGGYLGGSRVNAVTEDTALTAHFAKEVVGTTASAPSGVSVTAGDAAVTVRWKAPTSDGGEKITGYLVTSSPGVASCTTTGATSCRIDGLVNGTSYTFAVAAVNAAGNGIASFPSTAVTPLPPASDDSTSVAVSAASGRSGTKVWIRVHVTNKERTATQVRVDTRLGSRTVKRLAPGTSTSLTFVGRLDGLPASFATIVAAPRGGSLATGTVSTARYRVVFPKGT